MITREEMREIVVEFGMKEAPRGHLLIVVIQVKMGSLGHLV